MTEELRERSRFSLAAQFIFEFVYGGRPYLDLTIGMVSAGVFVSAALMQWRSYAESAVADPKMGNALIS